MSRFIASILLCLIASSAFAGEDEPQRPAPSNEQIRQQYAATLAKADKEQSETHAKNEKIIARTEAMLTRQEDIMKRQEEDIVRFERILNTWEHQQAQYQEYLNSLKKQ